MKTLIRLSIGFILFSLFSLGIFSGAIGEGIKFGLVIAFITTVVALYFVGDKL